jgi:hypothetical protein
MESFTLEGESGYLKIIIDNVFDFPATTCYWGGYDIKANIEIQSSNFQAHYTFYSSTGELFLFYKSLREMNELLKGKVFYKNYEENIFITLTYDNYGHITIEGSLIDKNEFWSELKYEFYSDQSYIKSTLNELEMIVKKYGGMEGVYKK